jgi:hypothetical protein
VRQWTNISQCAASSGSTSLWNPVWDNMSIVNPSVTPQQLSYPKTSLNSWLCETSTRGMNNTTPEGYLYYQAITPLSGNFFVNAIYSCDGQEGVANGYNRPTNHNVNNQWVLKKSMIGRNSPSE